MAVGYNPSIVSDGLVFFLDPANIRSYSGSGTSTNSLVSGIGGTLVNGVGFGTTNNGYFIFDGTDDYINIPHNSLLTNPNNLTINMWVRSNFTSARYSDLIGKGTSDSDEEYTIIFLVSCIYFDVGSGAGPYIQPSYTTAANTWYNVCCTHARSGGSSDLRLYLNGTRVAANVNAQNNTPNSNTSNVTIGQRFNAGSSSNSSFSGAISQVQIYNRTLTEQEILQNFNATRFRYGI
jgi:hypothetical protein